MEEQDFAHEAATFAHAFTQGPWVAEGNTKHPTFFVINSVNGEWICEFEYHHEREEEAKANARLIAQAPDLFAALSGLLGVVDFQESSPEFRQAYWVLEQVTEQTP